MKKPRIRINQRGQITAIDGMANVVTGLGRANAKAAATRYFPDDGIGDRDNAFRASTWYGKIVRIPAADAVREWRSWQADKAQIEKIEAEEKRLNVRGAVYRALLAARHAGGSVIVIGGLPGQLSQPLTLNRISKGSVKYLHVLGRDEISPGQVIRSPESPWMGHPERWTLTTESGSLDIHPSRVVLVNGRTVPGCRQTGQIWGDSIWVQMADSIRAADTAASVIDALMHEAKIDVVKVADMISQMAAGGSDEDYIARWTIAAQMKSISNVLLLDGSDEWNQKQINWTGLPDVVRTLLTIMAGAADIPVTRLTGEQQSGLSGSDAGSLRHYYDHIRTVQELEYQPALAPLDEIIIRSALGTRPDGIWYQWKPLWTPDAKQLAEIDKLEAEASAIYARDALVPSEALEKATQNRMVESGRWPGLEQALEEIPDDAEGDDDPPADGEGSERETSPDGRGVTDAAPRTLYVRRDVLNGAEIIAWAKGQGFTTTLPADDLHVTIAFSRAAVDWMKVGEAWQSKMELAEGGPRLMERFGEAKVLLFRASELEWRHESILAAGATWDRPEFQPHITISYGDMPEGVQPYQGKIILGPERFEEIKEDWGKGIVEE